MTTSSSSDSSFSTSSPSNLEKKDDKRSLAERYPAGSMSIYFGSQTGTAEGFARTLMEEGKARGFDAKMVDLEDFDAESIVQDKLAIFLMATYGEGEPTDNAAAFSQWLRNSDKEIEDNYLAPLKFTVFGLGNKQYEHFNAQGKKTNAGLEKLGAQRVFEYGEGDDDASLEEDFDDWKAKLWPSLVSQFHRGSQQNLYSEIESAEKTVSLQFTTVMTNTTKPDGIALAKVNTSTKHFFSAPEAQVLVNRELRSPNSGSTRHLEIDLKGTGVNYETADNLAILPENSKVLVQFVCKHMGYDIGQGFKAVAAVDNQGYKPLFPSPCSVGDCLTKYFDLQGVLRASTAQLLLPYINDKKQKDWLSNLLAKDNRDQFKALITAPCRSIVSLFQNELSSCQIPLVDFLHILPPIQPRYYTISSSSSRYPGVVHITVSITEYATENGNIFKGLTSAYIQNLLPSQSKCRIFVRPSSFRLPKKLSTPIVMIGPGTGIAPMRALLQEREEQGNKKNTNSTNILYFGCQSIKKDYIYRDELESFQERKTLTQLKLAFSRDQRQKVYVQHLLQRQDDASSLLANLDQGAHVYVCGATNMGTDVMEAITTIIQKGKKMSKSGADNYLKELQNNGRYVQELWTA